MLVLFETSAGFALFKVLDEGKLKKVDSLWEQFQTPEKAQKLVSLQAFHKFSNTTEALAAATALNENALSKSLKKFLESSIVNKGLRDKLAVYESKLGTAINDKFSIKCVSDRAVAELMRGIRSQINNLVSGLSDGDMNAMVLGLSHSLSRYKIKFSPDKVDTMIVQAIGLLDDLDKELNTYSMRVKEWYGWHFPEMQKIVPDNILYAKTVKLMGVRTNITKVDLSDVLPEELEAELKEAAQISMGTEISEEDIDNISALCDEVIEMDAYRAQLFDYLKNRMNAIAPNLTVLVGELVGARLIAHAGNLLNLAKHPASTVQILGAEKALFRALKTKHATPKYGLIYHASLIGQATSKNKGKMSRILANKAALSIRVDALGDKDTPNIGIENRERIEARLRQLEGREVHRVGASTPKQTKFDKYSHSRSNEDASTVRRSSNYNDSSDAILVGKGHEESNGKKDKKKKKQQAESDSEDEPVTPKADKKKKKKKQQDGDTMDTDDASPVAVSDKKKKKKREREEAVETPKKSKKSKHKE